MNWHRCWSALLLLLTSLMAEVQAYEQSACYVKFRYIAATVKAGTFEASARELWRVGQEKMRLQEAPDSAQGIHGLIISTAPDSWMINLFANEARHIVDNGPSTDIHAPILPPALNSKLDGVLEYCHEVTFFTQRNAKTVPLKEIDGVRTIGLSLGLGDSEIVLRQREDGQPFQVEFAMDGTAVVVRYDAHQNSVLVPADWFLPPANLKLVETGK